MYFQVSKTPSANLRPLQNFAEIFRQNISTGLLQCRLTNTRRLDFICHAGRIITGYEVVENVATRIEGNALAQLIQESGNLPSQGIDMATQSLRLYKAYVESCTRIETVQTTTESVNESIPQWQSLPHHSLFQLHWENADALVFLGGEDKFTRIAFLVGPGKSDADIYPALHTWPNPGCTLSRFEVNTGAAGWAEFTIQLSFQKLMTRLLARYKDLGGRSLLESLANEFNQHNHRLKWDINAYSNDVVDRELFATLHDTRQAYQSLLELVTRHMQAVIGPGLLSESIQYVASNSETFIQNAITQNNLLDQKFLATITG